MQQQLTEQLSLLTASVEASALRLFPASALPLNLTSAAAATSGSYTNTCLGSNNDQRKARATEQDHAACREHADDAAWDTSEQRLDKFDALHEAYAWQKLWASCFAGQLL